jgi:hypothetical protein
MTPLSNETGTPITRGVPSSVLLKIYRTATGVDYGFAVTVDIEVEDRVSEAVLNLLGIINLDAKGV